MKGYTGAVKLGVGVLFTFAIFSLFLFCAVPVLSSDASSVSNGTAFNVTYDSSPLYINWSGDIINVTGLYDGLILYIKNSSTDIYSNYSQSSFYTTSPRTYPNLNSEVYERCIGDGTNGMKFKIQNASTGIMSNASYVDNSSVWISNLTINWECPPGRYTGHFSIYNLTNSSLFANVSAIVDIPVNKNNTLDNITYQGFFSGTMPASYHSYHSYFFNTSELDNATSVTITLSGFSQDLDMFLLDGNGILVNSSMNVGSSASEKIRYMHLPDNEMWEIRVFGNVTSSQDYTGYLYFSRIDVNETVIDFGTLGPESYESSVFKLNNTDTQNVTNVNEVMELYKIDRWTNNSHGFNAANYSTELLVPEFAEKVTIKVEWARHPTGNVSNWTLRVTDPNGNLLGSSQGHYVSANISNTTSTESVTVTSIGSGQEGYWNISVVNASNEKPLSVYNITAYTWLNSSKWISTNFTNGTTLAGAGIGENALNATVDVNLTVNAPIEKFINGSYMGFLRYLNGSGWETSVMFKFDVKAGLLVLHHNISNSSTIFTITDNVGFDRNRFMNITYNNSGGYPIYYNYSTSSFNLTYGGSWINFTVDSWPGVSTSNGYMIPEYSSGTINITLNITNVTTNDVVGTYTGWILFNTTRSADQNMNATTRSYPYGNFNITFNVELNKNVTINITEIESAGLGNEMENVSVNGNFTFNFSVTLANGTRTAVDSPAYITRIWINESNITSYGVDLTDIRQGKAVGMCSDGFCYINGTVRSGLVGGRYVVNMTVMLDTGRVNLSGTYSFNHLIINNTGINMSINNNGLGSVNKIMGTIDEGSTKYFNLTVTNYGNKTANGKLQMSAASHASVLANGYSGRMDSSDDCMTAYDSANRFYLVDIPSGKSCWFVWSITANSIDGTNASNNLIVNITDPGFVNITGINFYTGNKDASTSTTDDDDDDTTPTDDDTDDTYDRSLSIISHDLFMEITLGESGQTNVTVQNTGDVTSTAKLSVTIDGVTASVTPSYCNLATTEDCDFQVSLDVNEDTHLGNHSGTYKAYVSGYSDTWYDEESFVLRVLSTPEREQEINASYQNLSAMAENLTTEFEILKASILGLVAENNLTRVNNWMTDVNTWIGEAQTAISSGDYITAEEKLNEVESTMTLITAGMAELSAEAEVNRAAQQGSIWIWVVIGAIIAVAAGFLIYMLMPQSGYHPKYGFSKENIFERIKRFFKKKGKSKAIKDKMNMKSVKKAFKRDDHHTNAANYAKKDIKNFYAGSKYEKSSSRSNIGYGNSSKLNSLTNKVKKTIHRKK